MNIHVVLLDFDGTLVTEDLLDVLCGLAGKLQQSADINQAFHEGRMGGIESLTQRINLLDGVSVVEVGRKLQENLFLRKGAQELMAFFRDKGIVSILNSGQILPALQVCQDILGIDYVVGTNPDIQDGIIRGIPPEHPIETDFKLKGCIAILNELGIRPEQVAALGDSPADRKVFEYAALSIAVDPKGGIEDHADHVIEQDLRAAIPIIERAMDG